MNETDEFRRRIVDLIRHHGARMVNAQSDNNPITKITSPDLFAIANELDAFFIGLKVGIDNKRNIS